jgi:NAD(P)-dependent dehydrogenase (short-subunit alcohol dehydrogenase family)
MSKVRSVFITGANRGIGLSLVKRIVPTFKPEKIFATFRDKEKSKVRKLYSERC